MELFRLYYHPGASRHPSCSSRGVSLPCNSFTPPITAPAKRRLPILKFAQLVILGAWFVLLAAVCLVSPSLAENPADLTFTLAPSNGRTTFRMGEAIDLEFRMSSTVPGKYVLNSDYQAKFSADPSDGLASPRGSSYPPGQLMNPGSKGGAGGRLIPLNAIPAVLSRQLNAFFSFRKTGHYRITAETDTVGLNDGQRYIQNPIVVRSNSIDIEIVNPEPGWAAGQLKADLALIAQWTPEPPQGTMRLRIDDDRRLAAINGVRALGLLETREAALALVDFFGRGVPVSISQYIDQGLRRSPYPKDIVAAMEKQVDLPDVPITIQWFETFSDLEAVVASNPPDYAKAYARSREKVVAGIEKKRGDARDISLRTIELLR